MAVIEKRGPYSYRIRFYTVNASGQRTRTSITHKFPAGTLQSVMDRDIQIIGMQLDRDGASGVYTESHITLDELIERYMTDYVKPVCSANYEKTTNYILNKHISPALGAMQLSVITPRTINNYLNTLRRTPVENPPLPPELRRIRQNRNAREAIEEYKKNNPQMMSERTVLHHYTTLTGMFNKAVDWGYLSKSPMDGAVRPKKQRSRTKALSMEQAVDLLVGLCSVEDMTFRVGVMIALMGGLRLGEVGALYFRDLNATTGELDVSKALKYAPSTGSVIGDPKSDAGIRFVSLPKFMVDFILEAKAYQDTLAQLLGDRWRGDGRIICKWDGSPLHPDTLSKQWRSFADRIGLVDYTFHELRTSHATILIACGVDVVTVAARMGHSDAQTTIKEYAKLFRAHDTVSPEILQRLFITDSTKNVGIDLDRLIKLRPEIKNNLWTPGEKE